MNKFIRGMLIALLVIGLFDSRNFNQSVSANDLETNETQNNEENVETNQVEPTENYNDNYVSPDLTSSGIDVNRYNELTPTQQRAVDLLYTLDDVSSLSNVNTRSIAPLVTGLRVFSDGTPTWTASGGLQGNDNSHNNRIVRSFDVINYVVDIAYNADTTADLVVEATIPTVSGQEGWFAWDEGIMSLFSYEYVISGTNNETVKIYIRNANPGFGASSKLPLAVKNAINGTTIQPTVKVYVDGTQPTAATTMQPELITVSATAKVNTAITRTNIKDMGLFEYGGYEWTKFYVSSEAQLLAENGGKGSEGLAGTLAYNVNFTGDYTDTPGVGSNATVMKILDYGIIGASGANGTLIADPATTGRIAANTYDYMGRLDLAVEENMSVYDSGTLSNIGTTGITGPNKTSIEFKFNNYVNHSHNYTTGRAQFGKVPFATAGVFVAVRGKSLTTTNKNYDIRITATSGAVTVGTSVSGQSMVGQNGANDDLLNGVGHVRQGAISQYLQFLSNNNPDHTFQISRAGEFQQSIGEQFIVRPTQNKRFLGIPDIKKYTMVVHFDPRAFETLGEDYYPPNSGRHTGYPYRLQNYELADSATEQAWYPADGSFSNKVWYGVSNVYDETTLASRRGVPTAGNGQGTDGITWYTTLAAAQAQVTDPTGLTGPQICAVRTDLPGVSAPTTNLHIVIYQNYAFKMRDNSVTRAAVDTGRTFVMTQYTIGYRRDDKNTTNTSYYEELGAGAHYQKYIKKEFYANGSVKTEGTHSYGGPGNVIRVTNYSVYISKKAAKLDGTPLAEGNTIVPKIDNQVKWIISPRTIGANVPVPGGGIIEVVDTVPSGLEVDQSSITPLPSVVTINADGTTTIKWEFPTLMIGEDFPEISYVTNADIRTRDGVSFTNTATVTAGSESASTQSSIVAIDNSVYVVYKDVDNKRIEKDGQFTYDLRYENRSADNEDVIIYDIFPYNGDEDLNSSDVIPRDSSFNGAAFATNITSTAPNSIIYYTYDLNVKYDTIDTNTFKTQTDWAADPLGFDLGKVTAIKVEVTDLKPNVEEVISISFNTDGNVARDNYDNNYMFLFDSINNGQPIKIPLFSNNVRTEVIDREVSGVAWMDFDHDGLRETEDIVLANVFVKLFYKDGSGNYVPYLDETGNQVEVQTDANGAYKFTNLHPNVYAVGFDLKNYELVQRELTLKDVNGNANDENDNDAAFESITWTDGSNITKELAMIKEIDTTPVPPEGTYTGVYPNNDAGIKALYTLAFDKSTTATEAKPGDVVEYVFEVKNPGDDNLTNVTIQDLFDDVNFVAGSSLFVSIKDIDGNDIAGSRYSAINTGVVVYDMPVGEVLFVTYSAEVKAVEDIDDSKTDIINTATATSDETDDITDSVVLPLNAPDMAIDKYPTDAVDKVLPSEYVLYSVKVENTGNVTLNNIVVNDPFDDVNFEPGSASLIDVIDSTSTDITSTVSVSGTIITVPSLAVGEYIILNYKVYVLDQANIDTSRDYVSNTVVVDSDETDPEIDSVELPLLAPAMIIDKSTTSTQAKPGELVEYTIKVENKVTLH